MSISSSTINSAYVITMAIVCCVFGDSRYADMVVFKGDKYMIISSRNGGKVVKTITNLDYPLNETGTPDAACNINNNYFYFKGANFWKVTSKSNTDIIRSNSASISSLFNTSYSSGINAALCGVEIDPRNGKAMQSVFFFKDKTVEKLRRLNSSESDLFQVVEKANLNFVPDAAVAIKITSYSSPFYYPIVASQADLFMLNMEYPEQMNPFGNLEHNLKLSGDEEMYFASDLAAAMSLSQTEWVL